ncbi:toll-like receptor 6 [Trematomus bernacchii]|uniref:toll-like receptor 6 n=1 Tax=Trematomus bernacchii TaxID=40690 RepID=UPI00146D3373|nr:toll-like receptor 6 [Trematomus bernacchii]
MEPIQSPETADIQPLSPSVPVPPTLRDGECYHVFISYSSTDCQWTHCLIDQLEACGLQVCYHERDFTPGRTVLENMSDCIQESQKVLLVLSPEFVRSRWCLLEANMSLFSPSTAEARSLRSSPPLPPHLPRGQRPRLQEEAAQGALHPQPAASRVHCAALPSPLHLQREGPAAVDCCK